MKTTIYVELWHEHPQVAVVRYNGDGRGRAHEHKPRPHSFGRLCRLVRRAVEDGRARVYPFGGGSWLAEAPHV